MPSLTVTVIIPTYNHGHVVGSAIESVLRQSLPGFEILVVDDGSEDDTRTLVEGIGDPRVVYICRGHQGRSAARNHGIRLALGRFIAFLDADDCYLPGKLERQVSEMERTPSILLSHTSYVRVNAAGVPVDVIHSGRFTGRVYPRILWGCPIATPTVMVRREALSGGLCFDERYDVGEDILLWSQIAERSEIRGIDECLSFVTVTKTSSAMRHDHQLQSAKNLAEFVRDSQPPLPRAIARRVLAELEINMAASNFAMSRYRDAVACAVRSHIAWPMNYRLYRLAGRRAARACLQTVRRATARLCGFPSGAAGRRWQ